MDAKRDVCLQACKVLYEMGELDEKHLIPKPLVNEEPAAESLDEEDDEGKDGAAVEWGDSKNLMVFPHTVRETPIKEVPIDYSKMNTF